MAESWNGYAKTSIHQNRYQFNFCKCVKKLDPQGHFPAGLPSPPRERFRVGWCFSMDCCSCSRRVCDVERPSATMYSRVLPQPLPVGSFPLRMCSCIRRARSLVSPMYVMRPEPSRIRYSPGLLGGLCPAPVVGSYFQGRPVL